MIKYSRQREAIYTYLQSTKSHPTADQVFTNVRQIYPEISRGTVYRNLGLLTELGQITRLSVGDGTDHYDADVSLHSHLYCNECGSVIDVGTGFASMLTKYAAEEFEGTIDGCTVMFTGLCPACAKLAETKKSS